MTLACAPSTDCAFQNIDMKRINKCLNTTLHCVNERQIFKSFFRPSATMP